MSLGPQLLIFRAFFLEMGHFLGLLFLVDVAIVVFRKKVPFLYHALSHP